MIFRDGERDNRGGAPADTPPGHVDDWGELVVDYLDGRLAPEAKAGIERHLEECRECAARVQTQQHIVTFLRETSLDDPPEDLEYRVLGEILFPSQPLPQPQAKQEVHDSSLWRRKIRPWIPAAVAVAALLMAVVGYGVVHSNSDSTERQQTASTVTSKDQVAGATPSQSEAVGSALGPTTTAAAATTTTSGAGAMMTTASVSTTLAAATQDRKAMVDDLRAADAPAYVAFEAPVSQPPGDGQGTEPTTTVPGAATTAEYTGAVTPGQADAMVTQMVAFTEMEPLEDSLSLGGPTFAAYVSRDDVAQLVDLLRSMGADIGLTVSLSMEPPPAATEAVRRLLERKTELPVLSRQRVPQPAVSSYTFTTSTLAPAGGHPDGTVPATPDQAGTHVLVVFYARL
jgi:anti-sigma factor RsiW